MSKQVDGKSNNEKEKYKKKTSSNSLTTSKKALKSKSSSDVPSERSKSNKKKKQQPITTLSEIRRVFHKIGPGDFQKIRMIGRGSVGRVYLVKLKNTDRYFAMKVLSQKDMIEKNKVKRVLTEREILAATSYPFIVNLFYSFQSRSRLYFIMEYCAGGELYRVIQTQPHKCLTEEQMRFYSTEVLLSLEYLHMMGFVYRDLKPENILLHESGHIRLTDFDLSKAAITPVNAHVVKKMFDSSPKVVAEPTLVTDSFVGTEEYIAPEVLHGEGYGASVDWWTLGILMYEMLYGFTPFRGTSQNDTFNKIEKGTVKFPEHPRCTVSKECKNLIKKLLIHDPKKRLGHSCGASDIKKHPFFSKLSLPLIRNQTPPIIPELSGPEDLRYFAKLKDDDEEEEDFEAIDSEELDNDHPFKHFTSVDKEEMERMKLEKRRAKYRKSERKKEKEKERRSKSKDKEKSKNKERKLKEKNKETDSESESESSESESESSESESDDDDDDDDSE